jgi:multiple sugar transport system ATP-binding protein
MSALPHSSPTGDPAVSVRDLVIRYGAVTVLDALDLDVGQGEFLVLLGPSGCGKSTLLNAIAGLLDVTDGEIWIGGNNVTWAEPKDRGIGMVFQSYALYPRMTVEGNMAFGLKVAGAPRSEIERRVGDAARLLRLENLLQRRPAQLSGGQRQRVAIGRALVKNAAVFLFDEPLSNLDAQLRGELRVEIKKLHQELGATMIYVTHDQIEALTLADRIAVMKGGRIQQLAPPQEIYRRPANTYVAGFVGSPPITFVEGTLEAGAGAPAFRSGGFGVPLATYPFRGDGRPGEVILGIRPEHIAVRPPREGEPSYPARIELVEPMGADTVLRCRVAGVDLVVRGEGDAAYERGQEVLLAIDPRRVLLFDRTSGDLL